MNLQVELIREAGKGFAIIPSRYAKIENYQKAMEKYELNPTEMLKKKILNLEKLLGYETSYF